MTDLSFGQKEIRIRAKSRAFSVIELVVVMLVIGILSAVTAASIIYVIQTLIYFPASMDVRKAAEEIEDTLIEGDLNTEGLRFASSIDTATATEVIYSYGYPATVKYARLSYDSNAKRLYAQAATQPTTDWAPVPKKTVPLNVTPNISIEPRGGPSSAMFNYYVSGNTAWTTGVTRDIRRVDVGVNVSTPTATIKGRAASFSLVSSAELKQASQ